MKLSARFRGYLPVVVDLETGGFDNSIHPMLELACQFLSFKDGQLQTDTLYSWPIAPFPGAEIDPASLKFTGIDPRREAGDEKTVLTEFFRIVRKVMKAEGCNRAILVAHNASFDQGFLNAACARAGIKRNPFHPFSSLDTASLAAVAYGHTVLSEACRRAGLAFDEQQAHSAAYDASRTAELFCRVVNGWAYEPPDAD